MTDPLRVLVVDDELLIADYVATVVELAGHEVVGVSVSAEGAMRILADQKPDLAILDIKLKGPRNGIELAYDMHASGFEGAHMFISGNGDQEMRIRAEATSPRAFLQKPFDSNKLIAAISAVHKERAESA